MEKKLTSLTQYLIEEQLKHPKASGDFTILLNQLTYATKIISREIRKAGIVDFILGSTQDQNIHGEKVQKLDYYSDTVFENLLTKCGKICALASEEKEEIVEIPKEYAYGKYVIALDPLDGSSNIDTNISIGTIFSIHKRVSKQDGPGKLEDFLQKASLQKAAGYIIYGSSTMLVLTLGVNVVGFTLDPSCGEFILSHNNIKIPEYGSIYSVNEANYPFWDKKIQSYIKTLKEPQKLKTSRYIGSLVADFHRNMLKGGIFLYPNDNKSKKYTNGKLRFVYEVAPMAYIAEKAGGMAVTINGERILDLSPKQLHERSTLVIGSKQDVKEFIEYTSNF